MRVRQGLAPIAPDSQLGYSENFFHMCFGQIPAPALLKAFDVSMSLYAEHGFNASTFTARVIASSNADLYAALTGAIGSLKGDLHGGANEAVMEVLAEIEHPQRVEAWLSQALAEKRKIMGFGHRVYKNGDSRVPFMQVQFEQVAQHVMGGEGLLALTQRLQAAMLKAKAIHPNLDFPTGPTYHLMGFARDFFTPLFVMARSVGWSAHVIEQNKDNRLIRPLSAYNGPSQRHVPSGLYAEFLPADKG
jgi:citrate synthase